ncbi:MAG: hypothetical protein ABFE07_29205 [Armatimonadia bacterium]
MPGNTPELTVWTQDAIWSKPSGGVTLGGSLVLTGDIRFATETQGHVTILIKQNMGREEDVTVGTIFDDDYSFPADIYVPLNTITGVNPIVVTDGLDVGDYWVDFAVSADGWSTATPFVSFSVLPASAPGGGSTGGPTDMAFLNFNLHKADGVEGFQTWLNANIPAGGRLKRISYNEDMRQQIVVWETGE